METLLKISAILLFLTISVIITVKAFEFDNYYYLILSLILIIAASIIASKKLTSFLAKIADNLK